MKTATSVFGTRQPETNLGAHLSITTALVIANSSGSGCLQLLPTSVQPCRDSQSLISRSTRLLVEDVVYVGVLPLVTVFGVVTNSINSAVFVAQGLGDRVNMSLFSLSIADLLVLLSLSVRYMNKTLGYVISTSWANNVWRMSLIRYRLVAVHAGFQLVSNFISIVISVDRCLCVTWPLRAARVLSTKVTALVIIIFSILAFAGIQFVAFKYDVTCALIKGTKKYFMYVVPSTVYKENSVLMEALDSFVFSSLIPTLSVLVTTVATIITTFKLRRATAWRDSVARGSGSSDVTNQKERALTKMLVVISCVYIACVSPRVLRSLCRFVFPEFRAWGSLCNLMLVTEALMNALLALNSFLNFFVYFSMGSRFRTTLCKLMTCRRTLSARLQGLSVLTAKTDTETTNN